MSTERDELAKMIAEADGSGHFLRNGRQFAYGPVADAVLAAGYRRPRTITTTEELDALSVGSVVLDRLDICYRLYNDPAHKEPVWCVVGELAPSRPHGWLPATVLHEGNAA